VGVHLCPCPLCCCVQLDASLSMCSANSMGCHSFKVLLMVPLATAQHVESGYTRIPMLPKACLLSQWPPRAGKTICSQSCCFLVQLHQSSLLSALRAFDHLTDAGLTPYTLVDLIKDKGSQKTLGKSSTNR